MLVINQNPKDVVPDITDNDINSKIFIAIIKSPYGWSWIYHVRRYDFQYKWFGLNCDELNNWADAIHVWEEMTSESLLEVLSKVFFAEDYPTVIFRLDNHNDITQFKYIALHEFSICVPDDLLEYTIGHLRDRSNFQG